MIASGPHSLGHQPQWTATYRGVDYGFCSARCRSIFLERPERFLGSAP